MSAKRTVGHGPYALPDNPSFIDFPRSDGHPSTWPTNTTRVVDSDGAVNFMEYMDLDSTPNRKWRVAVGSAVSLRLKMPPGPNYVLRSFPDGYRLFDHNKGPALNPRHDIYLHGPPKKRFRSINEFVPHAIWLMGDPNLQCECKYCGGGGGGKKTQREITASMSDILRTTPSLSQSQSPAPSRIIRPLPSKNKGKARANIPRVAEARQRDTKNYAAIQKTIQPTKASSTVLKEPMLVERNRETRALYTPSARNLRRWYRENEIVWCALSRPITGVNKNGATVTLDYWPAVVDEFQYKPRTISSTSGVTPETSPASLTQAAARSAATLLPPTGADDGRGPMLAPSDEPLSWRVEPNARYKVHFLAISHSMTIYDEDILPYQANSPEDELIEAMAEYPPERLRADKIAITKFNPCPAGDVPSLHDAIPAFALAIQIASAVSQSFCLTDEYELKFTIPPNPSVNAPPPRAPQPPSISSASTYVPQPPPPNSLQAALDAANRHNDSLTRSAMYESVSAVHPNMSASTAQQTASRIVGVPPPPGQLTQIRYQGIWWGAERIWADDFVRLKIPRRALAPTGDNHVLAPAGPSKSEEERYSGPDEHKHFLGAQMRGTFLRLDGIIVVDVESNGQVTKQARITGRLYELVAHDWAGEAYIKAPIIRPPIIPTRQPAESAVPNPVEHSNSGPPNDLLLPAPPHGYKFREILEPGYEFIGALTLLSGRYYPGILKHPRMLSRVTKALNSQDPQGYAGLWSLEGLTGGLYNSVEPYQYKKSRHAMMQDGDKAAEDMLDEYVQNALESAAMLPQVPVGAGDAMDVDGM